MKTTPRNWKTWVGFLSVLINLGCGIIPQRVAMDDQRIQPLLNAAASFDRTRYGFTPIPRQAKVMWESKPRAGYDAMLHIYSKTSRTIAFRKTGDGYRWIGEQEMFEGRKKYKSVDGTFNEHIVLTYETEHVSGVPLNRLDVTYWGEDPRLAAHYDLTLADVRPILKEWGY